MNAKVISLANSSCIRVIKSMSFYTWALTDGVWSFRETTKWAVGSQNWGSTEWFVCCAWHWVYVSLEINTAALAEPFLASFLKELSCICPSPPVTVELMDRRVSKIWNTHTLNENKTGKRGGILLKLPLRAAFHQRSCRGEQSWVLHTLEKLRSVLAPLRY